MKVNTKDIILLTACVFIIFFVCISKVPAQGTGYLIDLCISIIATIITVILLTQKLDTKEISDSVKQALQSYNESHFYRVDSNRGMGVQFWIDLITEMDTTQDKVWFIGKSLRLWLQTAAYKKALEAKLINRIIKSYISSSGNSYETYIILSDANMVQDWTRFVNTAISTAYTQHIGNSPKIPKDVFETKVKARIFIKCISATDIKQSIVLCGDKLVVTLFNSKGEKSEDSPTLDIKPHSGARSWFMEDINLIKEKNFDTVNA